MIIDIWNQIVSVEYALKLKELGIAQNSLFYYVRETKPIHDYDGRVMKREWGIIYAPDSNFDSFPMTAEIVSAFNATELGPLLPFKVIIENHECFLSQFVGYTDHKYNSVLLYDFNLDETVGDVELVKYDVNADKEADARAKMLIYLIENKLIPETKPKYPESKL